MEREIVAAVVGLLLLVALVLQEARLRQRVSHLERDTVRLGRSLADVQGWTEHQLGAVRGEASVARLNRSAAEIQEQRASKPTDSVAPAPEVHDDPEEQRATLTTPVPPPNDPKPSDEEGDATLIFEVEPPRFGPRLTVLRPPAPVAESEAVPPLQLGPDDPTPPRGGRAAVFSAFRDTEEGSAT